MYANYMTTIGSYWMPGMKKPSQSFLLFLAQNKRISLPNKARLKFYRTASQAILLFIAPSNHSIDISTINSVVLWLSLPTHLFAGHIPVDSADPQSYPTFFLVLAWLYLIVSDCIHSCHFYRNRWVKSGSNSNTSPHRHHPAAPLPNGTRCAEWARMTWPKPAWLEDVGNWWRFTLW